MRVVLFALFLILGESIQPFTAKYDVSCSFPISSWSLNTSVTFSRCLYQNFIFTNMTKHCSLLLESLQTLLTSHILPCMLSHFSRVWLFATPWTAAHQAPLSMGFSRQDYWSELLCSPPGDLPSPGIEPTSLMSPALPGGFFGITWEAPFLYIDIGY